MAMAIDQQQRHLGSMAFDHMSYATSPQFTNPWAATSNANSHFFPSSLSSANTSYDTLSKQQPTRSSTASMPYSSTPATAPSIGAVTSYSNTPYSQSDFQGSTHDLLTTPRTTYDQVYSTAPSSSINTYAPTSSPYLGIYQGLAPQQDNSRRLSQSSTSSGAASQASYDALDAGRGMVAMSQDLTTPRNIYGPRGDRGRSTDSYGFPSTHSSHSSISSASTYPSYYAGSVDSSVTDYSSNSEMEPINSRTLPRLSGLMGTNLPPAPQSMMGQFNSKVSSSTQKKHKCKVCEKRFTRPSSLQTHMYSHTGEKPYACEYDGCGRHFSVVSNLRRHRKVHKGERSSDRESPEGSWKSET